jgi:hypothetical protein
MQSNRIQEIRSKAKAERAEISRLGHSLSDAELKKLLERATSWLDDVEGFLIPHALKSLPVHEVMWVNHAEATLLMAVERKKFIKQLVATHRPDASTIGA